MDSWLLLSLAGGGCAIVAGGLALSGWLGSRLVRAGGRRRHDARVWRAVEAAARQLELKGAGEGVYEGRIGGRRVRWSLREVDYDEGPRLQLAFGTPVPTGQLGLTHRTMSYGAVPPDLELPLCRLGDAEFDVRFFAHADLEHLSLLTPSVRRALLHAGDDAEVRIRSGWLWMDHVATEPLVAGASTRIDWLFKAAIAFEGVQAEVEQRVRKMTQDPVARVRQRLLELLQARGASDFTNWIARTLADDVDAEVRARAAHVLGDGERLVAVARDAAAPESVRKYAGRALCEIGTYAERAALATVLAHPPHALPAIAMDLVADLPGDPAEPVLIELVQAGDPSAARRALARLASIGSARSLVILQALVDSEANPDVLRGEAKAAVDALRRSGRRSLPPEAMSVAAAAPEPEPIGVGVGRRAPSVPPTPRGSKAAKEATQPLPSRFTRRRD